MIMATTAPFFAVLLLSSAGSLVAGGSGDENNNDNVKRACADTPYPDMCFSNLSPLKESKDADAHMLAGMAIFRCTIFLNAASSTASHQRLHDEDMPEAESRCFNKCAEELRKASDTFFKSCETSDGGFDCRKAKLDDVRGVLADAKEKHLQWNCGKCRQGEQKNTVDDVEKFMAVLEVLLDHARK
jgi:pectinesterase inhibitor-like protein